MCRNIYLYPNGEDTQAVLVILNNLREYRVYQDIVVLDDAQEETSLLHNQATISSDDMLWVVHQDKALQQHLAQKVKHLPNACNGIEKLHEWLLEALQVVQDNADITDDKYEMLLNLASYFMLQFLPSLQENSLLEITLKNISVKITAYYQNLYAIPKGCVGIAVTSFSANKHLWDIGQLLEDAGIAVVYVYYDKETFEKIPQKSHSKAVILPLQVGYMGKFLEVFKIFVTCLMPLTAPKSGCTMVYVPHAYIDPIAALVQRNRPLDDFWFKRKVGIGGYRIVSSLSNYKIFKDKFEELGFAEELVCGGYPSLDYSIKAYENVESSEGGGSILIAINNLENLEIIEKFLMQICKNAEYLQGARVIFRPYPGFKEKQEFLDAKAKFIEHSWFVYDDSDYLSVEIMQECCVLVGDHSSLVWTFPLTTLKPAILLFKNPQILKNTYNGVCFFNPLLHYVASDAQEIFSCIQNAKREQQQKEQKIKNYRAKEVFNLGNSSAFIANFIIQIMQRDKSL